MTSNLYDFRAFLSLFELTELYEKLLCNHTSEGFFDFIRVWRKSYIYKLPCGYVRFEPYPGYGSATVHGIFVSNPFYHLQLVKNILKWYCVENPWIDHLECIVPVDQRGIIKLGKSITNDWIGTNKYFTFYWKGK